MFGSTYGSTNTLMISFILTHKNRIKSPIAIIISFKGSKYRRLIGESIPVPMWNPEKKRSRETRDFRQGSMINDTIGKWDAAAQQTVSHFKQYSQAPDKETFWKYFDSVFYIDPESEPGDVLLTDYFQIYIDRHKTGKSISCINKYITALHKFQAYEELCKKRLRFEDVDIVFYNAFRKWFFSQGFSTNYFGNTIKVLKQIYTEAKQIDGLHNCTLIDHKDFIGTREDTDSIYLTTDELRCLYDLDITPEFVAEYYDKQHKKRLDAEQIRKIVQSYSLIRDRFLIGAYTGLRVSDYGRLHDANFSGKFIRLRTKKTDTDTVIPMNSIVQEIVSRSDFSVSVSDQKMNKHIKEICRMAGIVEDVMIHRSEGGKRVEKIFPKCDLVCTHTARRSFATNAYKAGVPPIAIMKITGHRKESTFLKYIKVSAEENAEMLLNHPFFK